MKSIKARKQRKAFYNAPLHQKRKQISSHLEENLLLKYDRRRIPVVKGDTVRVMRGIHKGHEDKITQVHVKDTLVDVEGVTITKADGKKVAKSIHPSNLLITKLNLTDKWRRETLEKGLSDDKRKEIESEAKIQLKQLEEEQLKAQAALAAEEEETEEPEESEPEKPIKEEKEPVKEKPVPKQVKESKKEEPKEKTAPDTKKETKTTPKKQPTQTVETDKDTTKEDKA